MMLRKKYNFQPSVEVIYLILLELDEAVSS